MQIWIKRAQEILNWKKTGVLEGKYLREFADDIRVELAHVIGAGEALQLAEEKTKIEALLYLISHADGSTPEQKGHGELKAQNERLRNLLTLAERNFVNIYDSMAPSAKYDSGNRFADKDSVVQQIRCALSPDKNQSDATDA